MHTFNLKSNGFTLAEVLITLGIIGVVAAITIPTLIANINGTKYRSQFKKTLSTLNQAVKMNVANHEFDFSNVENCKNKDTDNPENTMSICAIFNGSLTGKYASDYAKLYTKDNKMYYKDVFSKATPDTLIKNQNIGLYIFTLNDGSIFAFHSPEVGQSDDIICTQNNKPISELIQDKRFQKYCVGFIDTNGTSLPNKETRCSDGKSHTIDIDSECIVPNKANYMNDVFPVLMYDATIAPASAAARYVLNTSK